MNIIKYININLKYLYLPPQLRRHLLQNTHCRRRCDNKNFYIPILPPTVKCTRKPVENVITYIYLWKSS